MRREPHEWPMTHRHLYGTYVPEMKGSIVGWDEEKPGRFLIRLDGMGGFAHYNLPGYQPTPQEARGMYRKKRRWPKVLAIIVILAVLAIILL